jgi:glycosidase
MKNWINNANIYHLYTLGFCGAERFRKDRSGTESRILKVSSWIPHIADTHFNAVLFGPVFESTEHGYDTADYMKIDARLGTNEEFAIVCEELHKHGIRVILDGVFNHVGRDFWAFRDLCEKGASSAYKDWFSGVNFGGRSPFGDNFSYDGWQGHYELVKLNLHNNEVVNHIFNAVRMWREKFNIDGIRFDAADCLTDDFIKRFHGFAKNELSEDFWLMGEIIHGNYARWANPEMFDSVTNYQCHKGIYSSFNDKNFFEISSSFDQQKGQYPGVYFYNFVDNHDVPRIASKIRDKAHLPAVYTMLYTMHGVPSVYYGSEFGIEGDKGSGAEADLPLRPNLNLDAIPGRNDTLLAHITKLGEIRRSLDILGAGSYDKVYLNNRTFVYKRELTGRVCYVALNIDDNPYTFGIKSTTEYWIDCLTGKRFKTFDGNVAVEIPTNTGMILVEEHVYKKALGDLLHTEPIFPIPSNKDVEVVVAETVKPPVMPTETVTQPEITQPTPRKSDIIPLGVKNNRQLVIGGKYHHFKGNDYKVFGTALDHETAAVQVLYFPIGGDGTFWVRPLDNFLEEVDDHGNVKERFALLV